MVYNIVMEEQVYCSVDLEFTGFDVTKDQILEVGLAVFKIGKNGMEILEEWSQVFRPTVEVHPKILGLTGITKEELDNAPDFAEYRDYIQQKLKGTVLVGHNLVMDIKFLESYGIKLSGRYVDTLDLVQFILPTHHSYNLENLMHYFGVVHGSSHRALSDCKTTIKVLEQLIVRFTSFDEKLKSGLRTLMLKGGFEWRRVLDCNLTNGITNVSDSLSHLEIDEVDALPTRDNDLMIDKIATHHEARVAQGCRASGKPYMVAVSSAPLALRIWKKGIASAMFASDDLFDENKFHDFLNAAITHEELRFAMKVLVWMETNWQKKTILDLNLSFFGGQYRHFITGGANEPLTDSVVVCDYKTLLSEYESFPSRERGLVLCGLQEFESYISAGAGTRLSWNSLLYLLRSIYNPENESGDHTKSAVVSEAIAGTDLFFALTNLLLKRHYPTLPYADLRTIEERIPHIHSRLAQAANNLADKLDEVLSPSGGENRAIAFLNSFFEPEEGMVRWIQLEEGNCILHNQPLEIATALTPVYAKFLSLSVTETITNPELLSFYIERLGLNDMLPDISGLPDSNDLLTRQEQISRVDDATILEMLKTSNLPAVVLLESPVAVKKFYDSHYDELKEFAHLYAQGYSGGGNKMLRNFGLRSNSIIVATIDFMAKQTTKINPHTLIVNGRPQVDFTQPYIARLVEFWSKDYPSLPRLLELSKITAALKRVARPQDCKFIFSNESNLTK